MIINTLYALTQKTETSLSVIELIETEMCLVQQVKHARAAVVINMRTEQQHATSPQGPPSCGEDNNKTTCNLLTMHLKRKFILMFQPVVHFSGEKQRGRLLEETLITMQRKFASKKHKNVLF